MGAQQYTQGLRRKKQYPVMYFLLRVHCWQYHQLSALHEAPAQPGLKKHHIIYRIHAQRGGRKHPVSNGVTYGKPVHHDVNQLKSAWSLQVLNSYWVGKDSTYKFFEVIFTNLFQKAIKRNPDTQWITKPQGDTTTNICRPQECGLGKSHKFYRRYWGFLLCGMKMQCFPAPPLLLR
ncbi:unnamed protein product [Nyctereutes procyonoides]|uniref:Ribosomal protein L15 n=1 Tax=Nyctereutes procyonoides TaxID=34880 RepID=A0A811Z5X2_NYCPR|nr:unnamed protein product [Nyctereutes procyonoides]